jgi:hypothetical protein
VLRAALLAAMTLISSMSGALAQSDSAAAGQPGIASFEDECFEARWGRWLSASDNMRPAIRPRPTRIWLTDQKLEAKLDSVSLRVLRVPPGVAEPGFQAAHWRYIDKTKELVLEWSTPFQGIRATIQVDTNTRSAHRLSGNAATWSHRAGDPVYKSTVTITSVRCFL